MGDLENKEISLLKIEDEERRFQSLTDSEKKLYKMPPPLLILLRHPQKKLRLNISGLKGWKQKGSPNS